MKTTITSVRARRIWDSRGRPTVEAEIALEGGATGRGIAPAGASRGSHEAIDLRDGGAKLGGYGVAAALRNIEAIIGPTLVGVDAADQGALDAAIGVLDRTPTKEHLGGNATIAVSLAALHAAAAAEGLPLWKHLAGDAPVRLPLPEIQIFGGGAHAGGRVDVQDFLVMPIGAQTFDEAMAMTAEVYRAAGELMHAKGGAMGVADEGGWWPDFKGNEDALGMLTKAIEVAGYRHDQVAISLDIAASEFREKGSPGGRYAPRLDKKKYETGEWIEVLLRWVKKYPILSVEDPVAEDDPEGFAAFTKAVQGKVQVIGDDFLVTNPYRVREAIGKGACNAVLLKPNQAGTVTETLEALRTARAAGWGTVVSARSGETEDTTIAHLAVGWDAGQLKVGSFARSERMAKWNEVLRIEEALGDKAVYAGRSALPIAP